MFFSNVSIANCMHDATYLAMTYRKTSHNYLDTNEGSVLSVRWSGVAVSFYNNLNQGEGVFAEEGSSKKCCQTKNY